MASWLMRTVKKTFKEMGYIGRFAAMRSLMGAKPEQRLAPAFPLPQFVQVKGMLLSSWTGKTRLYLRWDAYCQKAGLGYPSLSAWH